MSRSKRLQMKKKKLTRFFHFAKTNVKTWALSFLFIPFLSFPKTNNAFDIYLLLCILTIKQE